MAWKNVPIFIVKVIFGLWIVILLFSMSEFETFNSVTNISGHGWTISCLLLICREQGKSWLRRLISWTPLLMMCHLSCGLKIPQMEQPWPLMILKLPYEISNHSRALPYQQRYIFRRLVYLPNLMLKHVPGLVINVLSGFSIQLIWDISAQVFYYRSSIICVFWMFIIC